MSLSDTAWEILTALATGYDLNRSEALERLIRSATTIPDPTETP